MINWVKLVGKTLPNAPEDNEIPLVTELDELETFVGSKKQSLVVDCRKSSPPRDFSLGCRG